VQSAATGAENHTDAITEVSLREHETGRDSDSEESDEDWDTSHHESISHGERASTASGRQLQLRLQRNEYAAAKEKAKDARLRAQRVASQNEVVHSTSSDPSQHKGIS